MVANAYGNPLIAKKSVMVAWSPPPIHYVKVNTDGAAISNPGKAAGGGVFRDDSGKWILGFYRHMGVANSQVAELWAIRDALLIATEKGFHNLELETDSQVARNLILNGSISKFHYLYSFVDDCRNLILKIPNVRITHIFREGNAVADAISKMAISMPPGLHLLQSPPPCCTLQLRADLYGICYPRLTKG